MDFLDRAHPERQIAGFTQHDSTLTFYSFVRAVLLEGNARRVLDFGAGRGSFHADPSLFRREMMDLRATGAEVWACDIDPVVLDHPASDHQDVVSVALPYPDDHFDAIVSDYVFEHLDDPAPVAAELLRVLRPGGTICARTPNKWGYVALAARLVPNRRHIGFLRRIQPDRLPEDVFPTRYRLNTLAAVRRTFPGCEVRHYRTSGDPAYHWGSRAIYGLMRGVHRLLPRALSTSLCVFVRKPEHYSPSA